MRRADRQVTDPTEIEAIIKECKVCRIAMANGGMPYIVPMNFGYTLENGALCLYVHCAQEGKKIDMWRKDPHVCFEMDVEHGYITKGNAACASSFYYASVIGFGTIEEITDSGQKIEGFRRLMAHVTGTSAYEFEDSAVARTAVFRIVSTDFTGKKRV